MKEGRFEKSGITSSTGMTDWAGINNLNILGCLDNSKNRRKILDFFLKSVEKATFVSAFPLKLSDGFNPNVGIPYMDKSEVVHEEFSCLLSEWFWVIVNIRTFSTVNNFEMTLFLWALLLWNYGMDFFQF